MTATWTPLWGPDDAGRYTYGRCRSGKRWFWTVSDTAAFAGYDWVSPHHGWTDTEQGAEDAARAVVEQLATADTADLVIADAWHRAARTQLKLINAARRRARPPKPGRGGADPAPVEHLYCLYYRCADACQDPGDPYGRSSDHRCYEILTYSVEKTTATRIYFRDWRGNSYFVDRRKIDDTGAVYHHGVRDRLHLTPPEIPTRAKPRTLAELRREMADAHPDRGGDRDAFQAARARYENARRAAS